LPLQRVSVGFDLCRAIRRSVDRRIHHEEHAMTYISYWTLRAERLLRRCNVENCIGIAIVIVLVLGFFASFIFGGM
jgi:hypothetical protein